MTARPHPPGDIEVMRNNESHWGGLILSVLNMIDWKFVSIGTAE
jgi:hypothetical protein